jgi:drug/metabolite transporter (DMT)-like permease
VKGPAYLLAGIVLFSVLDANNKLLSGQFGVGQATVLRYVVLLAILAPVMAIGGTGFGSVTTRRPWLHAVRTASMMVSVAGFYLGFRHLPLAEGYLVFFTAPFLTLGLAVLLLREAVPAAAWMWCAVGFAGVLLAVLPKLGGGGEWFGYLAILLGTAAFAVTQTVNRMLRGEAGLARILFWPSLAGIVLYLPLAVRDWVPPAPAELAQLVAGGVFAGGAVLCTALAFRSADAARLGPYNYAALPVAMLLDLAIWGVWPEPLTMLGAAIVVAACVFSERARRGSVTGSPAGTGAARPAQAAGE